MLPIPIIQAIKKEAQEKLNRVFAEYFPGAEPPRLTDGTVRIILEVYEEKEIAEPDKAQGFALPCGCKVEPLLSGLQIDIRNCAKAHNHLSIKNCLIGFVAAPERLIAEVEQ